jgi:hypothetical protein
MPVLFIITGLRILDLAMVSPQVCTLYTALYHNIYALDDSSHVHFHQDGWI